MSTRCPVCNSEKIRPLYHLQAIDEDWFLCSDCFYKWKRKIITEEEFKRMKMRQEGISEVPFVSRSPHPA